jgi:hypothetical protein
MAGATCFSSSFSLFRLVLGVLFQLVGNVFMNRLSAADGNKVHHARLERSFVAVECCAPWILWIRGLAPTAVLPHDSKILEIEGGCLGIGNVGLALLIVKNSTGGSPTMAFPYSINARQPRG